MHVKKQAGLWIDHRKAVIVLVTEQEEDVKEVISDMEKHVRFSGGPGTDDGSAEDMRDRRFESHLNAYYDRVIAAVRAADSIMIFGPGEAKGELRKRLEHEGLAGQVLAMETADKMTDRQIAAKVRERFPH
jgi:hypothetical protein